MMVVLLLRRVLVACGVPVTLCGLLLFVLDARMAQGASPAPDPAIPNCFATLGNSTQFSSADASAVQQAVDAAGPGALVKVAGDCAGVQVRSGTTQTVLITQPLTLQGGYTLTNWISSTIAANPTILDAQARGRVISSSVGLSVTNLTVQNGLVLCSEFANCAYPNTFQLGGGIYAGAGLILSQVIVISNTGSCGSANAICFGGGVYAAGGASLKGGLFQNNLCSGFFCAGGGLYVTPTVSLTGTQFVSNTTGAEGGGLWTPGASVNGGLFQDNQCVSSLCFGGGMLASNTFAITHTRFLNNLARTAGGAVAGFGAGSIHQSCITGNFADGVYGMSNTQTIDASYNWWGASDGANPPGHGDQIDGNVNASPFLTTPVFACPSFLGHTLYLPIIQR